jgi:hypothetical protein
MSLTTRLANITGVGSWTESLQRAQAMVSNMTLDEKVRLLFPSRALLCLLTSHLMCRSALQLALRAVLAASATSTL